ncbi:hypothetical protein KAR91_61010, partial [Candidatus Pacearchaeota archaeon]|nr:hypothetical protein [Candidatus Pacearchaeota archaeon]
MDRNFLRVKRFLKRKPRTLAEANEQIEKVFPKSGMTLIRGRGGYELGPYRWSGTIYCPILNKD